MPISFLRSKVPNCASARAVSNFPNSSLTKFNFYGKVINNVEMRRLSLLIVAVLLSTATSSLHNVQKEGESANHRVKVYKLYHDWKGDNSFTERGMIILEVASDATRNESTARTKLGQATALPGLAAKVTNIDNCINVRAMDDLVQIGGMYRIKAVDEGGNTALASVPACSVRRANFR